MASQKNSFFHLMVIPMGSNETAAGLIAVEGFDVRCLNISHAPTRGFFPVSFDQAIGRLNELDRMFVELDGSFVWVSESKGRESQIDGMLTDLNDAVISVELKGVDYNCLDNLLRVFGWPELPIVIHDVRRGLFFEEEEYRRFHNLLCGE